MRVHITLADDLVRELDDRVGVRRRSAYIARAVERALDDDRRWELIDAAVGAVADSGHEWDTDPAGWVRSQRHADTRRVG
jgi:metal-responsive CopG/Arc/MetJ family transcriptional regulator